MYYAPHILLKRTAIPPEKDEYNRPIPGTGSEAWEEICKCRCDDNTTVGFSSDNGEVYRPKYHVVCGRATGIKAGDHVRCMAGNAVRGQGEVYMVKATNCLGYSEFWM